MYKILVSNEVSRYINKIKEINKKFVLNKNALYFINFQNDEIDAYAEVINESNKNYIDYIFVKKELRYRSYGTDLVNQVINYMAKNNVNEIYVKSKELNNKFFSNLSFTKENSELVLKNILKEEKRKKEGLFGTYISIMVNIFLAIIKITFGILGSSKALIADGFHSMSDVLSSLVIIFSIIIGSKPADEDHPYGHGKAESIAGMVVGVLLIFTAFELTQDIVMGMFNKKDFQIPELITLLIAFISIIIKYSLYVYKDKLGKKLKNDAILADARDHKSDVISTLGVLVGILLSIYIHPIFDTLTGVVVAFIIGKEGVNVILETSNKIMDKQDSKLVNEIEEYISSLDKISNIHDILLKYSGEKIYLSFHLRVNKNMRVIEAHDLSDDIKFKLLNKYPEIKNIIIHIDPEMGSHS